MKISIRNRSNKRRSKKTMQEMKEFAREMAEALNIDTKIKHIRLQYTKDFTGYYPKGKPLYGFKKLFDKGVVTICLTRHWDTSRSSNRAGIVHELTHVKQMLEKRLEISKDLQNTKWNGKVCNRWKKFNWSKYDELTLGRYYYLLPWEREVGKNLDKYIED